MPTKTKNQKPHKFVVTKIESWHSQTEHEGKLVRTFQVVGDFEVQPRRIAYRFEDREEANTQQQKAEDRKGKALIVEVDQENKTRIRFGGWLLWASDWFDIEPEQIELKGLHLSYNYKGTI